MLSDGERRRCSASGGAGEIGSKRTRGMAYQNRLDALMVNVAFDSQGAHEVVDNCSSEMLLVSGAVRRRRGRGYRAC